MLIVILVFTVNNAFLINETMNEVQRQGQQNPPKTVVLFNKTAISFEDTRGEPDFPFYSLNVTEYRKVWIYYQGIQGDVQTHWGVSFALSNLTRSDVFFLIDAATFSISDGVPRTLGLDIQGPYLFVNCERVGPGQNNTNSIFLYLT